MKSILKLLTGAVVVVGLLLIEADPIFIGFAIGLTIIWLGHK